MSQDKTKKSRLTLGVLTGGAHYYNESIWDGINEIAQEQKVNLICFIGLPMGGQSVGDNQASIIFSLANKDIVDGLLMLSGSVFSSISQEKTAAFIRQYGSFPMISIGETIPHVPSVVIDNYNGFYDQIVHLIVAHGRRRIAFVGGPEESEEAQIRYQAYKDALTQHNLNINANLITSGGFSFQAGFDALNLFINQRQVQFDAIVAASDDIALSIIEGLRLRGVHVPKDVSVIGFDDIPQSEFAIPPLTSVQQPVTELGRIATINMFSLLNGNDLPLVTKVPTIPITRQSCGCTPTLFDEVWEEQSTSLSIDQSTNPTYDNISRKAICEAMGQTMSAYEQDSSTVVGQVLDAFLTALIQKTPEIFLEEWTQVLQQVLLTHQDLLCWQEALSIMRRELLPFLAVATDSILAENLWHQARVLLTSSIWQAHIQKETQDRRNALRLQEINHAILMTFNMHELLDLLGEGLPRLGVKNGHINLYENPSPYGSTNRIPTWSRMIFAYDENGRFNLPKEGQRFPSIHLTLPNMLLKDRHRNLVIVPLYIKTIPLGFGLFEMDYPDPQLLILLRDQISKAIHGALLIEQIQQSKVELEKQVQNRTQELELRNAELERFTYTVSHDLKSPLITIQGFLSYLEKDALAGNVERIKGDINRISEATSQMHKLLDELLELSRIGNLVNQPEQISLTKITNQAILLVSGQINARGVEIIVPPDLPIVYGDPRRLIEVMQNLLDNAVKFMGQQPKPQVEIRAEYLESEILCSVHDNGIGINPQYHETVFGLFDRLDPSIDGTGIGLALVKRIIEMHNSRIWVESEGENKGTIFYFTLPAEK